MRLISYFKVIFIIVLFFVGCTRDVGTSDDMNILVDSGRGIEKVNLQNMSYERIYQGHIDNRSLSVCGDQVVFAVGEVIKAINIKEVSSLIVSVEADGSFPFCLENMSDLFFYKIFSDGFSVWQKNVNGTAEIYRTIGPINSISTTSSLRKIIKVSSGEILFYAGGNKYFIFNLTDGSIVEANMKSYIPLGYGGLDGVVLVSDFVGRVYLYNVYNGDERILINEGSESRSRYSIDLNSSSLFFIDVVYKFPLGEKFVMKKVNIETGEIEIVIDDCKFNDFKLLR